MEVAFGLPGVHNLALWRELDRSPIRLVGVRHEQAAAYAADGYARVGGRLGVALTTTGPGAANTLGAVGEAWASRSPILVIATDVPTTLRRPHVWRSSLHEASDQAAMFAPVVKHLEKLSGRRAPARRDHRGRAGGDGGAVAARVRGDPHRPAVGRRRLRAGRAIHASAPAAARRGRRGPRRRDRRALAAAADLGRRRRRGGGRGGGGAGGAAGGPGHHHVVGPRAAGRRPPLPGPGDAPRARVRRAVGRVRLRDRGRHRLRRDDDPGLAPAPATASDRGERGPRGRVEELPARRDGGGGRRRGGLRAGLPGRAAGRARGAGEAGEGAEHRGAGGHRGAGAARRDAVGRGGGGRHVHPGLLDRRLPPDARARGGCSTRSAGARSAARSRRRWAPRWPPTRR